MRGEHPTQEHADGCAAARHRAPDAKREVALSAFANVVIRIESAAGESRAPPKPCTARKAISEPSDQARPQSSELIVKRAGRL